MTTWIDKKGFVMKEYIVWGIAPDGGFEVPLFTQSTTMRQAVKVCDILAGKGCRSLRVQVLDLSAVPDFTGTVAI